MGRRDGGGFGKEDGRLVVCLAEHGSGGGGVGSRATAEPSYGKVGLYHRLVGACAARVRLWGRTAGPHMGARRRKGTCWGL